MDKVFSIEKNTLHISSGDIILVESRNGELIDIATTDENYASIYGIHLLPSTLIRKPKTDEELAFKKYSKRIKRKGVSLHSSFIEYDENEDYRNIWLAGRKSVGGEFHLTREELEAFGRTLYKRGYDKEGGDVDNLISSLTPPIHPTTITVEHDGEKYYWETLKAEY